MRDLVKSPEFYPIHTKGKRERNFTGLTQVKNDGIRILVIALFYEQFKIIKYGRKSIMDKTVHKLLNQQINKEFYSAYLYLEFSNYFKSRDLMASPTGT